jgi:hypothetical protein
VTPITAEPGVRELTSEEGRAMVDQRAHSLLGMSLDSFKDCYARGKLDLDDPRVQRILILLPFAR